MTEIKAHLRSLHIAPRKVRLLATQLKGLSVADAISELAFQPKRASTPLQKLISSAVANAKENARIADPESHMFIKHMTVDGGPVLKRSMPRAHGRAAPIRRRTSHISVTLQTYDA